MAAIVTDPHTASQWLAAWKHYQEALEGLAHGQQVSVGGRQYVAAQRSELQALRDEAYRHYRTLSAHSAGAKSPGFRIAKWS